jgi:hypothetical protein
MDTEPVSIPVWGTFSVKDHIEPEAFLRETLLFDRLAVPYPDPNMPGERDRWRHPDERFPAEDWQPDRLDLLLGILGTEETAGYNGARFVQRIMWNPYTWDKIKSRLGSADALTGNPFNDTALGIAMGRGQELPGIVEAVAAYPTAEAWRADVKPVVNGPADPTAAEALVLLGRPLLMPAPGRDELDTLRRTVDLAQSDDYKAMRTAYHDWFRGIASRLQQHDATTLADVSLDPASLREARRELGELWQREQATVRKADRDQLWSRVEVGTVSLSAAGAIGLACAAALPAVGVPVALLTFAGWAINKWRTPKPQRSLGGASMFVEAHKRLDFLPPPE